ncbi:hypothetical protein ACUN22_08985 [Streptomyces anulatus]
MDQVAGGGWRVAGGWWLVTVDSTIAPAHQRATTTRRPEKRRSNASGG